ncbi:hypothetical protein OGAPHI_000631 [Ogataea philodendri]|uniref:Uncharacterized protein n=1 Tax=Ogataea philodendri TaxID=1378263 RepID=A0A9P8PFZ2_9ASCO|nr:uncharacterized protein OGAPHI_000631 [Ogataea philodendri]KAH3670920.1 hypothetical protein OGAPHI_000631 [Ogataea philodendri]
MNAGEVKSVITSLDKAKDSKTILELLEVLKKDVVATEKFLRETKVGVAVNKLRTHADAEVSSLVKKIIKQWKEQVSKEKKTVKAPAKEPTPVEKVSPPAESKAGEAFVTSKPRNPANDGVSINIHDDSTRNGSISGLYTALAMTSDKFPNEIVKIAQEIEAETYKLTDSKVSDNYRNKMRSLIMNLRNKNNPELRARLLDRALKASKFVNMTNQELAPDALKKELADLHQKNLFDAQGAVQKRAVTDRFVCGKYGNSVEEIVCVYDEADLLRSNVPVIFLQGVKDMFALAHFLDQSSNFGHHVVVQTLCLFSGELPKDIVCNRVGIFVAAGISANSYLDCIIAFANMLLSMSSSSWRITRTGFHCESATTDFQGLSRFLPLWRVPWYCASGFPIEATMISTGLSLADAILETVDELLTNCNKLSMKNNIPELEIVQKIFGQSILPDNKF